MKLYAPLLGEHRQGRNRLLLVLGAVFLPAIALAPADGMALTLPHGLAVTRIEMTFANGRPDITVPKNSPPPQVYARHDVQGAGVLDALWMVDGRILAHVAQPVMGGTRLVFTGPRQPALPTYEPGPHTVTLQIRPPQGVAQPPQVKYYVTG